MYHNLIRCILNNPTHVIGEGKIQGKTETKDAYNKFNNFVKESLRQPSKLGGTNLKWPLSDILTLLKTRFDNPHDSLIHMLLEDATSQMKSIIEIIISRNRS